MRNRNIKSSDTQQRMRRQMNTAQHAMTLLQRAHIDVTGMVLGGRTPRLYVVMPREARPLPGTTYKRTRCDIGWQEERTAHAYGCRIDWEVAQ